jgi:hypothetical protein
MPIKKVSKSLPKTAAEEAGIVSVSDKVKEIDSIIAPATVAPTKKKRILSEEQKAVLRERLVKAREARRANLDSKRTQPAE